VGTACHLNGSSTLLTQIARETGIGIGESSANEKTSLKAAHCLGACGKSPVVLLDGQLTSDLTPEQILARIESWEHD
jgi:NADH:ubiquinone oxidoreductase subunit E